MIGWAMGAATGHTAVALWREEELLVCESNAATPYWPDNGIQCCPWKVRNSVYVLLFTFQFK